MLKSLYRSGGWGFGFLRLTGFLETLAQLLCEGFQAGSVFGCGLDVVVDLCGLLHGLAADRQLRVVNSGCDLGGERAEFRECCQEV